MEGKPDGQRMRLEPTLLTRSAHGTQAMRNAAAGVGTNNNAKPMDTSRSAAASASRTNNPHSMAGRPSMFEAGDHDRPS
jgi:hypothetical protein